MATGEFAQPIFELLDELEGSVRQDLVLIELIKFLPGEKIKEFVDHFRRNNDMTFGLEDLDISPANLYEKDDTELFDKDKSESHYFSSLIPEC
jgi:hypothetical protein